MLQVTECVQGTSVTLLLSGRFDFPARKPFQAAIKEAQATSPKVIILNFAKVPFLDSSALGLLMLAKKNVQDSACQLSLAVSHGYVRDVLYLAKMDKQFQIIELEQ